MVNDLLYALVGLDGKYVQARLVAGERGTGRALTYVVCGRFNPSLQDLVSRILPFWCANWAEQGPEQGSGSVHVPLEALNRLQPAHRECTRLPRASISTHQTWCAIGLAHRLGLTLILLQPMGVNLVLLSMNHFWPFNSFLGSLLGSWQIPACRH